MVMENFETQDGFGKMRKFIGDFEKNTLNMWVTRTREFNDTRTDDGC